MLLLRTYKKTGITQQIMDWTSREQRFQTIMQARIFS